MYLINHVGFFVHLEASKLFVTRVYSSVARYSSSRRCLVKSKMYFIFYDICIMVGSLSLNIIIL